MLALHGGPTEGGQALSSEPKGFGGHPHLRHGPSTSCAIVSGVRTAATHGVRTAATHGVDGLDYLAAL